MSHCWSTFTESKFLVAVAMLLRRHLHAVKARPNRVHQAQGEKQSAVGELHHSFKRYSKEAM